MLHLFHAQQNEAKQKSRKVYPWRGGYSPMERRGYETELVYITSQYLFFACRIVSALHARSFVSFRCAKLFAINLEQFSSCSSFVRVFCVSAVYAARAVACFCYTIVLFSALLCSASLSLSLSAFFRHSFLRFSWFVLVRTLFTRLFCVFVCLMSVVGIV